MPYNPATPPVRQTTKWTCSAASAAWVLRSMGIQRGEFDVVDWLGSNISSAKGLHEGSGRMLAALFEANGLDAEYGPLTWERALEMAGRKSFCMSGGIWYHWTAVSGKDSSGLQLKNPEPNHAGVGDHMERHEWNSLGDWNAVWINDGEDQVVIDRLTRENEQLRQDLRLREQRDESLMHTLGYLHGEVVRAYQKAHEGLRMALDAQNNLTPFRNDIRQEAYGHLDAVKAATNTLERHTRP